MSGMNQSMYPYIIGTSPICNQSNITINNLPTGASINWSSTNNLSLVSGQGTSTARFQKVANGTATINATFTIGNTSYIATKYIGVGIPSRPHVMNLSSVISTLPSVTYTLYYGTTTTSEQVHFINPSGSSNVSNWVVEKTANPNSFQLVNNGNYVIVNPLQLGGGSFTVKGENTCGASSPMTVVLDIKAKTGGGLDIKLPALPHLSIGLSPNPADDDITITIYEEDAKGEDPDLFQSRTISTSGEKYTIQLWSEMMGLVKSVDSDQPTTRISLSGMPKGIYFVHLIMDGELLQKEKLIVK